MSKKYLQKREEQVHSFKLGIYQTLLWNRIWDYTERLDVDWSNFDTLVLYGDR